MAKFALCLVVLVAGCAPPEVEFTISVKLDDPCLLTFPECNSSGYYCVESDGERVYGCQVACVAAREIYCGSLGPECTQVAGEEFWVPTLCISE